MLAFVKSWTKKPTGFIAGDRGFSLIEVAIGLMVISLIATPMIALYNNKKVQLEMGDTIGNMNFVDEALKKFVAQENRYPVPADLFLPNTDPNAGTEFGGGIPSCAGWPTANGVCRLTIPNPPGPSQQIYIGAVPFDALGLNPKYSIDAWGRKIVYAVTRSQTAAYVDGNGEIDVQGVVSQAPRTLGTTSFNNDAILISMGPSGKGAYSANGSATGNPIEACVGAGPEWEDANCDFANTTAFLLRKNENTSVGTATDVAGTEFYDDFTKLIPRVPLDIWYQNLVDQDYALTSALRVGVNNVDPQTALHVGGNVAADRIIAPTICHGTAGNECFSPTIITGTDPNMNCTSSNSAVLKIDSSQVYCAAPVDPGGNPLGTRGMEIVLPSSDFTTADCSASGALMTGIIGGVPQCVIP